MDRCLELMEIKLTEEQEEAIITAFAQVDADIEAFAEAIAKMATAFAEVCPDLQKVVQNMWDQIEEFIENHDNMICTRPERKGWRIPRKIIRNHQILDRRPMMIYIRNEI